MVTPSAQCARHRCAFLAYGRAMTAKATTPWGQAGVVDELVLAQEADGKAFSSIVQLLEASGGETLVRFAYATDGVARRGPVTLRASDVKELPPCARGAFRTRRRARLRTGEGGRCRRGAGRLSDGRLRRSGDRHSDPPVARRVWPYVRPQARASSRSRAASTSPARRSAPSAGPRSGSTACSGWGISPITFPSSFTIPATSRTEPFGLS